MKEGDGGQHVNLEKFHKELGKFLADVKRKPKNPYNDGYKDAIRYILDWLEEFV